MSDATRNGFLAEAKFLRAFAYLELSKRFSAGNKPEDLGVPLLLSEADHTSKEIKRASQDEVFTQIIKDLTLDYNVFTVVGGDVVHDDPLVSELGTAQHCLEAIDQPGEPAGGEVGLGGQVGHAQAALGAAGEAQQRLLAAAEFEADLTPGRQLQGGGLPGVDVLLGDGEHGDTGRRRKNH